jgi:zinc and cadmium transporter
MQPIYLITLYSFLIFLASLAGGIFLTRMQLTHTRLQIAMSLTGGLMLGVGLLHLLPHAFVATGSMDLTVGCTMLGLLTMFSLIRIFRVHQHEPPHEERSHCDHPDHAHDHHDHERSHPSASPLSWIGLMVGLSLHSLIDGVALASSVVVESNDASGGIWGVGAFLAIFLHKPLDAIPITTIMSARGSSTRAIQFVNVVFALMCPLGAFAFAFGVHFVAIEQHVLLGIALAFSAGVFLCISLSDLLPEVQFHSHDRFILTFSLIAGVVIAYVITFFEPAHVHGHGHEKSHSGENE